jgi:hypothetical protein
MAIYKNTPPIVTNGLVLALDAGNTKSYVSGSTVWRDLSGNNNSGSLTNGPTYSSANGGAIVFDGVNDYVNLGLTNISPTLSNLTISFFVKINKINTKQSFISSYTASPQGGWGVEFLTTNKINFFGFTNTTTFTDVQTNQTLSLNQIINITCVFVNSTFSIYINGLFDNSKSGVSTVYKTSNIFIGNDLTLVTPFNGTLSNMLIYNRALTVQEITQNYNATKGRFGL